MDISLNKTKRTRIKETQSNSGLLSKNKEAGKALHEMLFDEKGKPVDYRFIEVNKAFEKYIGYKRKAILGKTALELFIPVEKRRIAEYGKVATSGISIEFQDYLPVTDKYFQIKVTCPKKGLFEINMNDITNQIISKKENNHFSSGQETISKIKLLLSKAENRSNFLEEVCKYLVQSKNYYGAFVLLQYSNGSAKDLFNYGYGSNADHIRNTISKGIELPCCDVAIKRNGLIAICHTLYTCKDCVICQKDIINPAFSISLKYLDKTHGILVVSIPEKYVFDQLEVSSFYELAAEISFALHLFDHYSKEYLIENNISIIKAHAAQVASLTEKNEILELINKQLIKAKETTESTENCKIFFLENISHEIKNPLNGILGFSQLLQKSELLPAELKEYASLINYSGNQLLNTFNNFIDISKIEAGLIHLNNSKCLLKNLFTELHENYIEKIKDKKGDRIKLIYHQDKSVKFVFTDQLMLYKTLDCLLNNAVKYTFSGKIEFGCYYPYANNLLLFYVKDSGIGISKNKWKIIFDKFRQVEESSRKSYNGTGLGLSIAKGYVEKMQGKIWLESEVGKGTTFYFTLPYVTHNNDK